ncbi:MAG: hypothetical protein IKD53_06385 [Clostridia bacterium]|nr:hypothetical protein [Clostridia bacterium]
MNWKKAAGLYAAYKIGKSAGSHVEPSARTPMPQTSRRRTSYTADVILVILYSIFAVIGGILGYLLYRWTR